jgi:hypothetical protein
MLIDLFVIYIDDIRLIIFMGGAKSSLLPRWQHRQPKASVTTPFRLSQHSWKPTISLGMCQYHNIHDLGRNTTPIQLKINPWQLDLPVPMGYPHLTI